MPTGIIEAKPAGTLLSVVEEQNNRSASTKLKWTTGRQPLHFLYESMGDETFFTDLRDPAPQSRRVFHFFKPEIFRAWRREGRGLRDRLQEMN